MLNVDGNWLKCGGCKRSFACRDNNVIKLKCSHYICNVCLQTQWIDSKRNECDLVFCKECGQMSEVFCRMPSSEEEVNKSKYVKIAPKPSLLPTGQLFILYPLETIKPQGDVMCQNQTADSLNDISSGPRLSATSDQFRKENISRDKAISVIVRNPNLLVPYNVNDVDKQKLLQSVFSNCKDRDMVEEDIKNGNVNCLSSSHHLIGSGKTVNCSSDVTSHNSDIQKLSSKVTDYKQQVIGSVNYEQTLHSRFTVNSESKPKKIGAHRSKSDSFVRTMLKPFQPNNATVIRSRSSNGVGKGNCNQKYLLHNLSTSGEPRNDNLLHSEGDKEIMLDSYTRYSSPMSVNEEIIQSWLSNSTESSYDSCDVPKLVICESASSIDNENTNTVDQSADTETNNIYMIGNEEREKMCRSNMNGPDINQLNKTNKALYSESDHAVIKKLQEKIIHNMYERQGCPPLREEMRSDTEHESRSVDKNVVEKYKFSGSFPENDAQKINSDEDVSIQEYLHDDDSRSLSFSSCLDQTLFKTCVEADVDGMSDSTDIYLDDSDGRDSPNNSKTQTKPDLCAEDKNGCNFDCKNSNKFISSVEDHLFDCKCNFIDANQNWKTNVFELLWKDCLLQLTKSVDISHYNDFVSLKSLKERLDNLVHSDNSNRSQLGTEVFQLLMNCIVLGLSAYHMCQIKDIKSDQYSDGDSVESLKDSIKNFIEQGLVACNLACKLCEISKGPSCEGKEAIGIMSNLSKERADDKLCSTIDTGLQRNDDKKVIAVPCIDVPMSCSALLNNSYNSDKNSYNSDKVEKSTYQGEHCLNNDISFNAEQNHNCDTSKAQVNVSTEHGAESTSKVSGFREQKNAISNAEDKQDSQCDYGSSPRKSYKLKLLKRYMWSPSEVLQSNEKEKQQGTEYFANATDTPEAEERMIESSSDCNQLKVLITNTTAESPAGELQRLKMQEKASLMKEKSETALFKYIGFPVGSSYLRDQKISTEMTSIAENTSAESCSIGQLDIEKEKLNSNPLQSYGEIFKENNRRQSTAMSSGPSENIDSNDGMKSTDSKDFGFMNSEKLLQESQGLLEVKDIEVTVKVDKNVSENILTCGNRKSSTLECDGFVTSSIDSSGIMDGQDKTLSKYYFVTTEANKNEHESKAFNRHTMVTFDKTLLDSKPGTLSNEIVYDGLINVLKTNVICARSDSKEMILKSSSKSECSETLFKQNLVNIVDSSTCQPVNENCQQVDTKSHASKISVEMSAAADSSVNQNCIKHSNEKEEKKTFDTLWDVEKHQKHYMKYSNEKEEKHTGASKQDAEKQQKIRLKHCNDKKEKHTHDSKQNEEKQRKDCIKHSNDKEKHSGEKKQDMGKQRKGCIKRSTEKEDKYDSDMKQDVEKQGNEKGKQLDIAVKEKGMISDNKEKLKDSVESKGTKKSNNLKSKNLSGNEYKDIKFDAKRKKLFGYHSDGNTSSVATDICKVNGNVDQKCKSKVKSDEQTKKINPSTLSDKDGNIKDWTGAKVNDINESIDTLSSFKTSTPISKNTDLVKTMVQKLKTKFSPVMRSLVHSKGEKGVQVNEHELLPEVEASNRIPVLNQQILSGQKNGTTRTSDCRNNACSSSTINCSVNSGSKVQIHTSTADKRKQMNVQTDSFVLHSPSKMRKLEKHTKKEVNAAPASSKYHSECTRNVSQDAGNSFVKKGYVSSAKSTNIIRSNKTVDLKADGVDVKSKSKMNWEENSCVSKVNGMGTSKRNEKDNKSNNTLWCEGLKSMFEVVAKTSNGRSVAIQVQISNKSKSMTDFLSSSKKCITSIEKQSNYKNKPSSADKRDTALLAHKCKEKETTSDTKNTTSISGCHAQSSDKKLHIEVCDDTTSKELSCYRDNINHESSKLSSSIKISNTCSSIVHSNKISCGSASSNHVSCNMSSSSSKMTPDKSETPVTSVSYRVPHGDSTISYSQLAGSSTDGIVTSSKSELSSQKVSKDTSALSSTSMHPMVSSANKQVKHCTSSLSTSTSRHVMASSKCPSTSTASSSTSRHVMVSSKCPSTGTVSASTSRHVMASSKCPTSTVSSSTSRHVMTSSKGQSTSTTVKHGAISSNQSSVSSKHALASQKKKNNDSSSSTRIGSYCTTSSSLKVPCTQSTVSSFKDVLEVECSKNVSSSSQKVLCNDSVSSANQKAQCSNNVSILSQNLHCSKSTSAKHHKTQSQKVPCSTDTSSSRTVSHSYGTSSSNNGISCSKSTSSSHDNESQSSCRNPLICNKNTLFTCNNTICNYDESLFTSAQKHQVTCNESASSSSSCLKMTNDDSTSLSSHTMSCSKSTIRSRQSCSKASSLTPPVNNSNDTAPCKLHSHIKSAKRELYPKDKHDTSSHYHHQHHSRHRSTERQSNELNKYRSSGYAHSSNSEQCHVNRKLNQINANKPSLNNNRHVLDSVHNDAKQMSNSVTGKENYFHDMSHSEKCETIDVKNRSHHTDLEDCTDSQKDLDKEPGDDFRFRSISSDSSSEDEQWESFIHGISRFSPLTVSKDDDPDLPSLILPCKRRVPTQHRGKIKRCHRLDLSTHKEIQKTLALSFRPCSKYENMMHHSNSVATDNSQVTDEILHSSIGHLESGKKIKQRRNSELLNSVSSSSSEEVIPESKKRGFQYRQECFKILEEVYNHEMGEPFRHEIRSKQVPGYYLVVKRGMCLDMVAHKLRDSIYEDVHYFVKDMQLIFCNCRLFNQVGSPMYEAGQIMEKFFQKKFTEIFSAELLSQSKQNL